MNLALWGVDMDNLHVKHQYKVEIHWLNHPVDAKEVLAINSFQAKQKVISDSDNDGMYNAEKSFAKLVKSNVSVKRA
jgi:hypothetical protein